jgi:hypothetical protein
VNSLKLFIKQQFGTSEANANTDGSYWIYQYDDLGQVTGGKKYWSDGTPVAGQQMEYGFDRIGNRTSTKTGGDEVGSNLRFASYSVNNLNQYTSRDVPGYLDIKGIGLATNTVTVNGMNARANHSTRDAMKKNTGAASRPTNQVKVRTTSD